MHSSTIGRLVEIGLYCLGCPCLRQLPTAFAPLSIAGWRKFRSVCCAYSSGGRRNSPAATCERIGWGARHGLLGLFETVRLVPPLAMPIGRLTVSYRTARARKKTKRGGVEVGACSTGEAQILRDVVKTGGTSTLPFGRIPRRFSVRYGENNFTAIIKRVLPALPDA